MFCPRCRAEFRAGYTRCSTCDVKLVESLPPVHASAEAESGVARETPVALWSGQDPVVFSVILSALDEAEIAHEEVQRRDFAAALSLPAVGFYGMPHWEVCVHPRDLDGARAAVETAMRPRPIVADEVGESEPSDSTQRHQPSSAAQQSQSPIPIWYSVEAGGAEADGAEPVRALLAKNGIQCWEIASSGGNVRLFVSQDDAARARELIGGNPGRAVSA
jgi:hypothetical protein